MNADGESAQTTLRLVLLPGSNTAAQPDTPSRRERFRASESSWARQEAGSSFFAVDPDRNLRQVSHMKRLAQGLAGASSHQAGAP